VLDGFDPELYLRLRGEHAILDPEGQNPNIWTSAMRASAAALVAIGALEVHKAEAIVSDYELAGQMRGLWHRGQRPMHRPHRQSPPSQRPKKISPARVVDCNVVANQAFGKLKIHYVTLGDDSTSVRITATETSPGLILSTYGGHIPQPTVTDDRGNTETATYQGGSGAGSGYHGALVTDRPLSKSTEWIEVEDTRIELGEETPPPTVKIERLPELEPASKHLQAIVALQAKQRMRHSFDLSSLEATIGTLDDAGALPRSSPVVDQFRNVVACIMELPPRAAHLQLWPTAPAEISPNLPEPWRSWQTARNRNLKGHRDVFGIGALASSVDGTTIWVESVISSDDSFDVQMSISPDSVLDEGDLISIEPKSTIVWWAEDDKGGAYLGISLSSWQHDDGVGSGTLTFIPALDPNAKELRLTPTGPTERAVMSIALPERERRADS
jgi:hypothetical protein